MIPLGFTTFATGFGVGLSLIVAIGAQNAFVLRQGITQQHVTPVIAVCAISDAILIIAGVAGIGTLITHAPALLTVTRVIGAVFLFGYAALAARRAITASSTLTPHPATSPPLGVTIATCVALTWLNPHVYLDTVILLGSIANTYSHPWLIAAGAALASLAWFSALGYGARLLRPLFAKRIAWRVLDGMITVIMTVIALALIVNA